MEAKNTVLEAHGHQQSIWLDYLSRELLASGKLRTMVEEQGLRGITSNPKIFSSAMSSGSLYEEPIRGMAAQGKSGHDIYEALAVADVRSAADLLEPFFGKGLEYDGFVSLEVSPHLAYKTSETIDEARRLWKAVDHPNVLIKVPATEQGLPAIRTLIAEGINVNVTLLFGLPRYREVADAYMSGLEDRLAQGESLEEIYSVASFFLSRIDVLVDPQLDDLAKKHRARSEAGALKGNVAIASAKLAYQIYKEIVRSERFRKLADRGAHSQWLLWGSTSTKNPEYRDVRYVEALIGPQTINTLPEKTLAAFLDHGHSEALLERELGVAQQTMEKLAEAGIEIDDVTQQLETEGVKKFVKPFDELLSTIEQKQKAA